MKLEIEGTEEEIRAIVRGLSTGLALQSSFAPQQEKQREQGEASPEVEEVSSVPQKRKYFRRSSKKYALWTDADDQQVVELLRSGKSVKKIAKEMGRTTWGIYKRINKLGGMGIDLLHTEHEPPMLKQHATLPFDKEKVAQKLVQQQGRPEPMFSFPELDGVTVSQEIAKSIFKLFTVGDRERMMAFSNDGYAFGIDRVEIWNRFISDAIMKSAQICASLNVPNKMSVVRNGNSLSLKYSAA
jgi:hypothetical protein